jgi:hypothetical protein
MPIGSSKGSSIGFHGRFFPRYMISPYFISAAAVSA